MRPSPHVHFDEAKIIAATERRSAILKEHEQEPGSLGAQARLTAAGLKPVYVAMVREMNRGTSHDDLGDACAALLANIVLCWATSNYGEPGVIDLGAQLNQMLGRVAVCVMDSLTESPGARGGVERVPGEPGGHA